MNRDPPPHIVLECKSNATTAEIKRAYHSLAKKWHPDKYQGAKSYAERQFGRIQRAYEAMLNPSNTPKVPQANPRGYTQMRRVPVQMMPPQRRVQPHASTLCNGTVLLGGGFDPRHMTAETLFRLQRQQG